MRFSRFSLIALVVASVAVIGASTWAWRSCSRPAPLTPELGSPMLTFAVLADHSKFQGKRLFFTPAAVQFLKPRWQELEMTGLTPAQAAQEFEATIQNPKAWRTLDRKWRFDALLLTGDPAEFRQLLDHLRSSPDWTLTSLDHTSLVFERTGTPPIRAWTTAQLTSLLAVFDSHSAAERETVRVQAAHRLIAIGECEFARTMLEAVIQTNSKSAPAWTELAICHSTLRQWDKALVASEKAVALDKNYMPALTAKANALYANGKFNAALKLTRILAERSPEDGQILSLHAKVTHSAHAYLEEIEVLSRIIELSKAKSMPLATWRIYLAQAYASNGQGEPSLKEFEAALKEPDLSDEERVYINKGVDRIESRKPTF